MDGYYAYDRDRRGGELRAPQRFTGQKQDGSGLIYMHAQYYDPQLGQCLSQKRGLAESRGSL